MPDEPSLAISRPGFPICLGRASGPGTSQVAFLGHSYNRGAVIAVRLGAFSNVRALLRRHAMSKRPSKSKRRSKALPALGFAGVSLSMASGACASTEASANTPPPSQGNELFLGEEELSDVSLATFYVFDKENAGTPPLAQDLKLAAGGCGGGGGGCGGGGGRCGGGCGGGGCHMGCGGGGMACASGIHPGGGGMAC